MTDSVPLIDAHTVELLSPMPALIAALQSAFANGGYESPPRYAGDMSKTSSLLLMPSWNESSRLGVKIVNVDRMARPSVRSSYVLMDRATARPLVVMDGAALTRRRTAAIAGDLAALCQKKHAGRDHDRDAITLFKSVGAALEDLAAAELVFEKWRQK